ncbi:dTDP-4-dehydrorhamnose 3,5-epimerase [Massilia pseudoviolaceinigra]|uniref:dTDP-4-dehydrorhamnose 3,5-epimerase n=1 Tax=Massilia pseudoviolaceinigra TaxID=3057165 RepID=UPI002796693A|nr:dTDP-4-dehydrorhamnose 3,5-epimerase [Massilia sp. CCM 9206]MDQ1919872.1 dTDP-4-dehydrorhamnose 3,5-epimerase [Massilia sp. CCM 9206]
MKVTPTAIPEVLILEPRVFGDDRGFFFESFNERKFEQLTGVAAHFVQDNHSKSARNVLRGLHYQISQPQGKLVRVSAGAVYDVVVDLRQSSAFFGRWIGLDLSAENQRQLWVPPGFAHGFMVTSESAEVQYKTTDYWAPELERVILWNDPDIGIEWPLRGLPMLSGKDSKGALLAQSDVFP